MKERWWKWGKACKTQMSDVHFLPDKTATQMCTEHNKENEIVIF